MELSTYILIGVCAFAGVLLGLVIAFLFRVIFSFLSTAMSGLISWVIIILMAGLGGYFLPPHATPFIGPIIAELTTETTGPAEPTVVQARNEGPSPIVIEAAVDAAIAELNDPFFNAVLEKEPSRAEAVRSRLSAAYVRGGDEALSGELQRVDRDLLSNSIPYYLARAQDQDLIDAVHGAISIITVLSENDPEVCHTWLYGSMTGQKLDRTRYVAALGEENHKEVQSQLAALVKAAFSYPPEYDVEYADQTLLAFSEQMMDFMGVENIGLITSGQRPATNDEAKLACDASADLFNLMLEDGKSVDLLRHHFLNSGY